MAQTKQVSKEIIDERSNLSAVERQTEASHKGGTIWDAVRRADQAVLEHLLDNDPNNVNARGPVGDCPIHMLFLYGTEAHLKMARYLIKRFPEIVIQIYNQPEYYGEIVLHIAIINRNAIIIEWLLSNERVRLYREQQLTATASGHFFQYGRPCYYGETPLAFACCTNQWNIVEILLKYGASMDVVDNNGNTILHLVVIHNLPKIYTKFKERWLKVLAMSTNESRNIDDDEGEKSKAITIIKEKEVPLWKRLNKNGFTPFTLAAKLGVTDMFSFLLDERKIIQWRYGPVSCVLYPLDELEFEFQQEGRDARPGALELIVQSAQTELITHPRMIDLLNKKWECFARRIFFCRFFVTLIYLFIFLLTTILDQTRTEITEGKDNEMIVSRVEYPGIVYRLICTTGRLIVLTGAISKGESELREMNNVGIHKYFQTTGSALLENCLSLLLCAGIIILNILRLFDMEAYIIVLALVSIIGWVYMLFFAMAFKLTGPFVFMIYKMLLNDVLRFCIIYIVFLIGFSQAFFVLFNYNGFSGFLLSIKQCFFGMLGDFNLDHHTGTTFQYISMPLLVIYVVVVSILLLNLLIAMMGDTYGNVIESATQIWHLERARIIFAIENEMSIDERMLDKNKYWTNVDGQRYLQIEEIDKDCFRDINNDETDKSYTCLENLSNELLYEILEYIDAHDIYKSFSNLNNRLQNLIISSSLLLRIKLNLKSISLLEDRCEHVIIPNSHRILSLHLIDELLTEKFFDHCIIDSSFYRLESLTLNEIQIEKLLTILFYLNSLPRLFSLTISIEDDDDNCDLGNIYQLIFSLSSLKYNKLYLPADKLQINIPHVINKKFSKIEHLVLYYTCTLNQLNCLLHYTPQLRHLFCNGVAKSDEDFRKNQWMKLPYLKSIHFDDVAASFEEFEVFIKEISSQLQTLKVREPENKTYLDGNRWEELIKEYMPQLETFYFSFNQDIHDDRNINLIYSNDGFINRFNSPFWFERKWFREIEVYCESMTFIIRPYKKEWIDLHQHMNIDIYSKQNSVEDNYISNQEKTADGIIQLTIENYEFTEVNWQFINKLKSAFKAIQFTHLNIDNKRITINMLLDILCLLPNIESLKLLSIPILQLESLSIEDTKNQLSVLAINKITKVRLGQVTEEQEIQFFIDLCPHMQYLEVDCMLDTDVPLLMKLILINRMTRIPDLCYLCFIIPMADENMVRTLAKIIDSETVIDNYSIKRSGNKISVHWKL
ncbi:unnamed protein product [Adineta steineri]|uniref:F-box domain-containing protein n=1 Tax=Adineta steineri TaxID=433720 RepID=A0A818KKQ2_9BILA|nr:unnamed protein product [Adineta steineri]CAF3553687.1 unnamed protein product [Adineta steineri]